MGERLQFGKIPTGEYVGPPRGYVEDDLAKMLEDDPDAEYLLDPDYEGVPDWEDASFTREDLEVNQIKEFLNEAGIIKQGQEIGIWATHEEKFAKNQSKISYVVRICLSKIDFYLRYRLRVLPGKSFFDTVNLKVRAK